MLIKALRAAHAMLGADHAGLPVLKAAPPSSYPRRLVRLAFLAPDLQSTILAGRQPLGLTLAQLMRTPMPGLWSEQATWFEALAYPANPPRRPMLARRWSSRYGAPVNPKMRPVIRP